jgi:hypothetical protein
MRYSEIFNVSDADLDSKGVFNTDVDSDSQLHIDPSLFKYSQIPEFNGAYDEFNNYFARVFTGIVPYAKNDTRCFNQLIKYLSFREIANTCLGYSKSGTRGSGIGGKLAKQVAQTVIELYDIGIKNPVAFEMLPFFEEGIGSDRISDMSAYLLIQRLINYTQRVCTELGIPMEPRVKLHGRPTDVPTYKNHGYVFVPFEVLCDLPTARSFDDIDSVCHYNDMFRRRICEAIGAKWSEFKDAPKSRIKQYLFDNPEVFKDFINEYEHTKHQPYNFVRDKKRVMGRCYTTSLRGVESNKHVRVEFKNEDQAKTACDILQHSKIIKEISVQKTDDEVLKGRILYIYPQIGIDIKKVEQEINSTLLKFFLSRTIFSEETIAVPAFEDIKKIIIEELNKAINTIYVCVAWFTDDELRDVLLAKHQADIDVRVITYLDGVNKKNGVDFKDIPHIERRGERSGLMHRKYCIIDNHVTISGSYNWTDNASERNDENIEIIQDWNNANTSTRQFLDDWNKK